MSWEYSENVLIQESAANLLQDKLGWQLEYAYNKEVLGEGGTLGRKDYTEFVLLRHLKDALYKNNPWLDAELCEQAVKKLLSFSSSQTLMDINADKYKMLKSGIPVTFKNSQGETQEKKAVVFNFIEPTENHFLAVQEMKLHGDLYRRRTDIVGFVNGIPLLFIELKAHNVDIKDAYDKNYTDYQDTIPKLFHFNAFVMFSNGEEARVGTLGSKYEFFHEWKRLKEEDVGCVDLETMLLGICNKQNFMDLFENFILFDKSNGRTAKILARNHQYLGVNEAVQSYKDRQLNKGKLGVFWHTQGSGKSYSMIFLAEKIRRKMEGSPTIVVLTDRDELNKQISETFEACGCLGNIASRSFIPKNGERLVEMLKGNPSYIFTLIHKFNKSNLPPIIPTHDILILSDEAHRTQNGIFAENMCTLLPTASKVGFTGTPLFAYDNITEKTFGSYVSIYDFKRAVEDGATVPLYYENRGDKLGINNPEISDELLQAVENADLDVNEQAKVEMELRKDIHIITAKNRLEEIAKDFTEHYTNIWQTGKAMFVCVNKVTTVRMYNMVNEFWQEKINETKTALKTATQQEYQELSRKLAWLTETEMAVVVSGEQNEIKTFEKWGLDIKTHREKMEKRELDKEFKDEKNPLRIVFVCAMWLTGFDVKCMSAIYLDKPLKAHTLMQTIARANRVNDGKSNGLVVDYIGVVKALRKALAEYTNTSGKSPADPTPDKEELIAKIAQTIDEIKRFVKENGFNIDDLVRAEGFEKHALIMQGANALTATTEIKKKFEVTARELFKLFKYVDRTEVTAEQTADKNAISALYNQMQAKRKHSDTTDLMVQINNIVSEYISVEKPEQDTAESRRFDISKIDFERLRQEFARVKNRNLLIKDLQSLVEERLQKMMQNNPLRIDYYERYQQIITDYNEEQNKTAIEKTFVDLMSVMNELDDESKRYVREGFENDEELTMYDLLLKETLTKSEIGKVKAVSKTLLSKIKAKIAELDHWTDKEETLAIVDVLIRDTLYDELPESYDDGDIATYRGVVFEHVRKVYRVA